MGNGAKDLLSTTLLTIHSSLLRCKGEIQNLEQKKEAELFGLGYSLHA